LAGTKNDTTIVGIELRNIEPILKNFCDVFFILLDFTGFIVIECIENLTKVFISEWTGINKSSAF
jgi:hypothetical protein